MYYINQIYKDGSSETSKTSKTIRIGKYFKVNKHI